MRIFRQQTSRLSRMAFAAYMVIAISAGLLTASCSRLEPMPPLARRVAVLDFKTPASITDAPRDVKGFWLGARTIRQNREAGSIFADALSRELSSLKYLEQQSRPDIKFYMSQKRSLLSTKLKGFGKEKYEKMMAEVSPVDFGSELGVDQVVTGEILSSYMSQHRTFGYWFSFVRVRVDVWDMATGKVVWSREFSGKKHFLAQIDVMEEIAARAARVMAKKFYEKANKPL